ncbi:ELM2 domain-containing protein [Artemisia annua]|uniref:ELM2 domain-containing protein n=1 Tax=Artemisia annua TaxID=35608 RepID=A0A2U1M7C5_ARTAN|nr:ELM2 domain-containing protein [Artemisia annua]
MGTKRPFDEDLQEFIKHPRHIDNGNKPDYFGEDKHLYETSQNGEIAGEGETNFFHAGEIRDKVAAEPDMVDKAFETSDPLPLVTGISGREEACGLGPAFFPNIFPEFFEVNMPRRQLVHYDDTYSSLLNISPRKEVPVGPEYQADVPEFDSESAKSYISNNGEHSFVGICVISDQEGEVKTAQVDCSCLDSGSIRCVQQHVSEARLNLKECLGHEIFIELGFGNMGEEVSSNWSEEEEQLFQDVVYSNPVSHGKRFWEQLSIAFPSRTKKEIVSYYFNVFILRRRAVQNRSHLLAIDSDDDEWWGPKRETFGATIEDEDFHVVEPFADHQGHDFSSEAGDEIGGAEGDDQRQTNEGSSTIIHDEKVITSENEQEKPLNLNKQEANSSGVRSESYLHWDPPYSTMGPTKGVDLLPTCSMIEEIFGSSKTSRGT